MKATINIEKVRGLYFFMNGDKQITSIHLVDGMWYTFFHDFMSFKTLDEAVAGLEAMIRKQAEEIGFEVEFLMPRYITELRSGDYVYYSDESGRIAEVKPSVTFSADRYLATVNGRTKPFNGKAKAIAYVKKQLGDAEFETIIKL
jgi:hypothetical protein